MKIKAFFKNNIAVVGLVIVWVLGFILNHNFLSVSNMNSLLRAASYMGCLGIGMTFVILCGSIDLSVGAVFSLAGYYMLYFSQYSLFLAIFVPLLISVAIGLVNGVLVGNMHIPAFVATLAIQLFVRGWVQLVTNETTYSVKNIPSVITYLARKDFIVFLPIPFVMFILLAFLSSYFLKRRESGRAMYIVGGNTEAANMMGINVNRTFVEAHILCSVMSAIGGMISVGRSGAASPIAGNGYEMYAIAAAVLGGALLTGGVGTISGTFVGILIMSSFTNIFSMQKVVSANWQEAFIGAILVIVIVSQAFIQLNKEKITKARSN